MFIAVDENGNYLRTQAGYVDGLIEVESIPENPEMYKYNNCWQIRLDLLKEQKKKEINQARENARENEGAEYKNDIFDIDEKSQSNITAIITMLSSVTVPDDYTVVYRSKTNVNQVLTKKELIELGVLIGTTVTNIYKKSWDLKAQVDNANTKEEVENIKW